MIPCTQMLIFRQIKSRNTTYFGELCYLYPIIVITFSVWNLQGTLFLMCFFYSNSSEFLFENYLRIKSLIDIKILFFKIK